MNPAGIIFVSSYSSSSCLSCIFLLIVLAMLTWGGTQVGKALVATGGGFDILSTISH